MSKKTINYYFVLLMAVVPLIVAPMNKDIFDYYKVIIVAISSFLMLPLFLREAWNNKVKPTQLLVLLYGFLIMLSTIFSKSLSLSIFGLPGLREGIVVLYCYFFIFLLFSNGFDLNEKAINIILISSILISIYGICQFLGLDPIKSIKKAPNMGTVTSTIGNRDFVGTYCTLMLPIFICFYIKHKKTKYLIAAIFVFLLLVFSITRSAWVAFAFQLIFFMYFLIKNRYDFKKNITKILIIILAFAAAFSWINAYKHNLIVTRIKTMFIGTSNFSENSAAARLYIWKRVAPRLLDHPILGYGPDTFRVVYNKGKTKPLVHAFYKAHNEYLQIALTEGWIALGVYLTIVISILLKLRKIIFKDVYALMLFLSISGYLIQAFFNISYISNAVIYWALLGIAASYGDVKDSIKT